MSKSPIEEWLHKAEEDFRAAAALEPTDVPDVVCFLCHQCIEKYLKAVLARLKIPPPRIHDLAVLNDLLAEQDKQFDDLCPDIRVLTPFSVAVRYPGTDTTPTDAKRALRTARKLRKKIRVLLNLENRKR